MGLSPDEMDTGGVSELDAHPRRAAHDLTAGEGQVAGIVGSAVLGAVLTGGGAGAEVAERSVAIRATDEISSTSLRGKSLTSGEKILRELGLVKRSAKGGGFEFVDEQNVVRVRWDRGLAGWKNHWHKFYRDSSGQIHRLTDSGHFVQGNDRFFTKVHIPSK